MSITIRLSKVGKRNAPAYTIVVANTKDKRNGRFLDVVGYYNPAPNPVEFQIDMEKYKSWKEKGALSTKAVDRLINKTYTFVKYSPKTKDDQKKKE
ncbi:30S ribosomal protein S16 [candidate division WWE3 bacterium]|nr:30S ribosomal protein S16 [candidate division WWE3 bacterium]